jgi:hypothetical protein
MMDTIAQVMTGIMTLNLLTPPTSFQHRQHHCYNRAQQATINTHEKDTCVRGHGYTTKISFGWIMMYYAVFWVGMIVCTAT